MRGYKTFTDTTAVYPGAGSGNQEELNYLVMGLASEAGEVANIIKKAQRRQELTADDIDKLFDELGDVLYYWTRLCYESGNYPERVMQYNIHKLSERQDRGGIKDR